MAKLTPVDYDPFAEDGPSAPSPKFTPVDYDPFAEDISASLPGSPERIAGIKQGIAGQTIPEWARQSPTGYAAYKTGTEQIPYITGGIGGALGSVAALPGIAAGAATGGMAGEAIKQMVDVAAGVSSAPKTSMEAAKGIATEGALQGGLAAAGPVLSAGGKVAGKYLAEKLSPRIINSIIKPLGANLSYGKNPGRVISEEGIVANTFEELGDKVSQKKIEIGQTMGKAAELFDSALKGQRGIDLKGALKPLDNAMLEAMKAPETNKALISRIEALRNDLTGIHILPDGTLSTPRQLSDLSFSEAVEIKRTIGDITKWTGNLSDDKLVNKALKNVYGNVKDAINNKAVLIDKDFAKSFAKLNEKYADTLSADLSIKYRDKIYERANLVSLPQSLGALGASLAAFVESGGSAIPTILAGAGTLALEKAFASTAMKTRIASTLAKMSPERKMAVANLSEGLDHMVKTLDIMPPEMGLAEIPIEEFRASMQPRSLGGKGREMLLPESAGPSSYGMETYGISQGPGVVEINRPYGAAISPSYPRTTPLSEEEMARQLGMNREARATGRPSYMGKASRYSETKGSGIWSMPESSAPTIALPGQMEAIRAAELARRPKGSPRSQLMSALRGSPEYEAARKSLEGMPIIKP